MGLERLLLAEGLTADVAGVALGRNYHLPSRGNGARGGALEGILLVDVLTVQNEIALVSEGFRALGTLHHWLACQRRELGLRGLRWRLQTSLSYIMIYQ